MIVACARDAFEPHPGDVLFFPAWMWHKTVNRDPDGLGITCRFTTATAMSTRYLRAPQCLPASFWTSSNEVVSSMIQGAVSNLTSDTGHHEQEVVLHT